MPEGQRRPQKCQCNKQVKTLRHRGLLADRGLLKGKTIGVDATTLEANAAMRSIVRRDSGENYEDFLKGPQLPRDGAIRGVPRELIPAERVAAHC
jgi:hypothetical protein